jgi:(1->4)-alpha-D-glucan 1-alpha-D-glucosylmutase
VATYRLQFNPHFTLVQATGITDYLFELGISDCYVSPLLAARPGSLHGYDLIDHSKLNSEIGSREDLNEFAAALKSRGMGLLMDVVPNHMCIATTENVWWNDILENGPGSQFASYFDIDWSPPKQDLKNKVLLPVLGDQYGKVLENQEIKLSYQRGSFYANYYETKLPIEPHSSLHLLKPMLERISEKLDESHPQRLELESIITALEHLPSFIESDSDKVKERRREEVVIKRRLSSIVASSRVMSLALKTVLIDFNGRKGDPQSFDRLEQLLAAQPYRLSYWRVAADEINYRRFFDVNELAAIRVEEPRVFAAVHDLIFRLIKEGVVTGLRIDHIDGLYDPGLYLRDLQGGARKALHQGRSTTWQELSLRRFKADAVRPCYVVVEKILGQDEQLRPEWAAHGTTGYDFLNLVNGLFVDPLNESAFSKIWERVTGAQLNFEDVAYESKKLIMRTAMSSELTVLARILDRISEQHRYSRDFTLNSLQDALAEVIACFPVYRSYLIAERNGVGDEDRRLINTAVRIARRRNPAISRSIFEFIRALLLIEDPEGISDEQRRERRNFVMRFQQLTGPVIAKGIEDTASYRYYPLASLCEVGGELSRFGVSVERFHELNRQRLAHWPHTLLATSTHDTKRSEDVRARINVLSEIPSRWYRAVRRWQKLNRDLKSIIDDLPAPDESDEYLLYQTLIGTWPIGHGNDGVEESFIRRIQEYLIKAAREAKIHSSWLNQNEEYEKAVRDFIERILTAGKPGERENPFIRDFIEFQSPVARAGMFNSLSQTFLKIVSPGVPDFYQGTEIWDFSLVDPDNRRPVDYAHRRSLFDSLTSAHPRELMQSPEDGRIKLMVTSRALNFRRDNVELFERGEYLPLHAIGKRERHALAFSRRLRDKAVIAVASRFFMRLTDQLPVGEEVWGDTAIAIPAGLDGCYRDLFTGCRICAQAGQEQSKMRLAEVFSDLPIALLERV